MPTWPTISATARAARSHPLAATRLDLAGYLQTLRDQGRAPATIARRLVAVRGLYDLAVCDYGLSRSPADRLRYRRPRVASRIGALNWHQLRAFLTAADRASRRTAALAWLLATSGLRVSEACRASRDQITASADHERWLEVVCKNNLTRSIVLHPQTWARIAALPATSGPIFATATGRPIDRQAAARALAAVAADAGIDSPFSPHVLRHTFITLARQAGCPLEDVQEAAGHADPATTRAYDRTLRPHRDHPSYRIFAALDGSDARPPE